MRNLGSVFATLTLTLSLNCGGGDDDTEGVDSGSSIEERVCSSSNPCPSGQFCWNGLCALGCNSNADCAEDQYCDTEFDRLCHNKTVTTCPETPCAEGQICRDGLCSTPPEETGCTPRPDGHDGCDEYSICLEEEDESTACYSFPACDHEGNCPIGTRGAVCNDGIVPNKAHICLTGLCTGADNCPSSWQCVKLSTDVVGMCADGQFGSVCLSQEHCQPGLDCIQPAPGTYGFCQPGF
jgi:hypothetical protein